MSFNLARSILKSTKSPHSVISRSFSSLTPLRAINATTATKVDLQADVNEKFTFNLDEESSFETHNCATPESSITLTRREIMDLYKLMLSIRRLETLSDQMYKSKLIRGFCHLSSGQEAIAAGMESAITQEDAIITAYRCHGFTYARGASAFSCFSELMGRVDGTSKGKGGSMHMFAHEFYGGNGIVGAQVPVGAGIAFKQKYMGQQAMTFSLYGDGAANQGQVFEAYNMAKLWNLPVTFTCENNKYGMGTSAHRAAASTKYYARGDYIPGVRVNGMDVLAVKIASSYARKWCIEGSGPLVLEMVTYRYGGHSMSDPGINYRTREEVQHMRSQNDPITGLKKRILDAEISSEEILKAIDKEVRTEMDEALARAKESPLPPVSDLHKHIYVEGTEPPFVRGRTPDEIYTF
ncbi:alpha subunit of pyruvate dehydrogenase [Nowakowskiella sp. JEL0407]|nr:alpha subunit of pyruvate dehydrogenase [Nowakowskiella sp. JEL0407]